MRKKIWLAIVLLMIPAALILTASCAKEAVQSSSDVSTPEAAPTPQPEAPEAADVTPEEAAPVENLQAEAAAREAAEAAFLSENIHFELNSAALSGQAPQVLNAKAEYLHSNPALTITVQGHCDERGTDAYNMALGKKRAESVKNYLVNLGIPTERLNTVSYGKSRPIATGQDEASWSKNRRAQFVIN